MARSFRAELTKLLRWPAFWILVLVWAALSVLFAYATPYITYTNPAAGVSTASLQATLARLLPAQFPGNTLPGYPLFGGVIALTVGAMAVGSEYGWGTWTTILLQGTARAPVVAGKLAALLVAIAIQVAAGVGVNGVASVAVARAQGASLAGPDPVNLVSSLAAAWLILVAGAAVGGALAAVFRGTALPIGIGFAYLLVERLVAGLADRSGVISALARTMIGTNAGSLATSILPPGIASTTPGLSALVSGPQAAVVLAAYLLAAAAILGTIVVRSDVR